MKLQVSLSSWSQNIFLSSLSAWFWFSNTSCLLAWGEFSCRLACGCPISEFESRSTSCLVALTTSFLSSAYPRLTPTSQTLWKDFFTLLVTIAQDQTWLFFRRWITFIRSRLLTSFWLGALLSDLIVSKKITAMATRIPWEIHLDEQNQKLSPLWVGFWC